MVESEGETKLLSHEWQRRREEDGRGIAWLGQRWGGRRSKFMGGGGDKSLGLLLR